MVSRTGTIIDRRNWDAENHWYQQGLAICWYDKHERSWTAYRIDPKGNQVTHAAYFANAEQVVANQEIYFNRISSPMYDIDSEGAWA